MSAHPGHATVPAPEPAVVEEAIAWLVRLQSGEAQPADWEACQRWRAAQPTHAMAWERLQRIQGRFNGLPDGPRARTALDDARRDMTRRRALRLLSVAFVGGATAWLVRPLLPVDQLLADHSTGAGERRRIELPDGTLVWLDTRSAVDVRFTAAERRLVLRQGRVALSTGRDGAASVYRPLWVETRHGTARALGTRFQVGLDEASTQVQVFEHAVELQPREAAVPRRLQAGESGRFDASGVHEVAALNPDQDAWTDGLLVARDMPLGELIRELARYRPGWLACDNEVAQLRISGVFSLSDTDRTLALVEKTLPVRVQRRTNHWVTLQRRT
ncbi:FecR domain-containing protein [Hydrogenophaga palleronii]|uniref:FecR domain-containing protein n=1 Tax=Hydrogenophaga palleronii TaxID=65655 RepID=UPI0008257B79|nr:FecR domain-containing protein [Hydrogenophaga palleronii]